MKRHGTLVPIELTTLPPRRLEKAATGASKPANTISKTTFIFNLPLEMENGNSMRNRSFPLFVTNLEFSCGLLLEVVTFTYKNDTQNGTPT